MSDWLERLRGLVRAHERAPATEQSRRVEAALMDRSLFASEEARLDAAFDALGGRPPDPRALEHLVETLKPPGFTGDLSDEDAALHVGFWRRIAALDPVDPVLEAHLADVELELGDRAAGLRRFLAVFDARPELFTEFGWDLEEEAEEVGGDELFRWQVHQLRWMLHAAAEQADGGDDAREIYGALLDQYREDPARLALLQRFGAEIQRLEASGGLPRAMVVRKKRRPREG